MVGDDAILITYEDTLNLIRHTVWRYIRQHERPDSDFPKLFEWAQLTWFQAYYRYDPRRGDFSTWIVWQIWGRLLANARKEHRDYVRQQRPPRDQRIPQPGWAVIDSLDELTDNGRRLLLLIADNLDQLEKELPLTSPRRALRRLYRWLREEQGWTRTAIQEAFTDMKTLFA